MSLTKFVNSKAVRERFDAEFERPELVCAESIKAPPPVCSVPSKTGTAFDYMVRVWLQRRYPRAFLRPLLARTTVDLCKRSLDPKSDEDDALRFFGPGSQIWRMAERVIVELTAGVDADWVVDREAEILCGACQTEPFYRFLFSRGQLQHHIEMAYVEEMDRVVSDAEAFFAEYVTAARPNNRRLAEHVLDLAEVDPLFRNGYADPGLGSPHWDYEVDDLVGLLSLFAKQKWHRGAKLVVLNPAFGKVALPVGGADADIILDGMLVDIKCVKEARFNAKVFRQLMGYYVLSTLAHVEGTPRGFRVRRLGAYFARHGELLSFPVESVLPDKRLRETQRWFVQLAKDYEEEQRNPPDDF